MPDNDLSWIKKELEKNGSFQGAPPRFEKSSDTGDGFELPLSLKILTSVCAVIGIIAIKMMAVWMKNS